VGRRRAAAALDVAEHRRACLHARARLDLGGDGLADGAVLDAHVAELVDLARVLDPGELAAFARDDYREVLAARTAAPDDGAHGAARRRRRRRRNSPAARG